MKRAKQGCVPILVNQQTGPHVTAREGQKTRGINLCTGNEQDAVAVSNLETFIDRTPLDVSKTDTGGVHSVQSQTSGSLIPQ